MIASKLLRRATVGVSLLVWLPSLAGCEGVAAVVDMVQQGDPVASLYTLPDVDTLVLVDDGTNLIGPDETRQIATTAVHYLTVNESLIEAKFIDVKEVAKLESQLGREWPTTPIDDVGRRLGATQIIYARITQARFEVSDNLYRPDATIEVLVIKAADASRLWPSPGAMIDPKNPAAGHVLKVNLDYETRDSRFVGDATPDDYRRRLADEIGLSLARIFYTWKEDPPGTKLPNRR